MEPLRIYRITNKYVSFLHSIDSRVQFNKNARRPYVGIVLTVSSYRYFVPMESPKDHHQNLHSSIHIMPLENGHYGILGFNNMIPVPLSAIIEFDINDEPDHQYAELLRRQASYINRHRAEVYNRAAKTYFRATTKTENSFFKKVCCDFRKLESACDRYNPQYRPNRKPKK